MNRRGFLFGSIFGGVAAAAVKAKQAAAAIGINTSGKDDKRKNPVFKVTNGRMLKIPWESIRSGDKIYIDHRDQLFYYEVISAPNQTNGRQIMVKLLHP